VAVVGGGRSSEREVSLVSAAEVARALRTPLAADRRGPARVLDVTIERDGRWTGPGGCLRPGVALERLAEVDLFFLALHGGEGEDGTVQGFLAAADRVFTGSGVGASALGMDKVVSRELLRTAGARVAPARLVRAGDGPDRRAAALAELAALGSRGWFVKPRSGGSSVGTTEVLAPERLEAALAAAHAEEDEALVEARVEGVEATVGVITTPGGELRALEPIEIRPHAGRFFDYHEKYAADGAAEICPARSFSPRTRERLRELGLLAHRLLRCDGYSRSDFVVPMGEGDEAGGGEPVFLELNTLPGLTPRSLVPLAARTEGVDYRTLCLWIAAEALARGVRRAGRGAALAGGPAVALATGS